MKEEESGRDAIPARRNGRTRHAVPLHEAPLPLGRVTTAVKERFWTAGKKR